MRPRTTGLILAASCLGLVVGCGTPPWQDKAPGAKPTTAAPSATKPAVPSVRTPRATATSPKPTVVVENDLATGSAKRKLEAGGVRVSINYWSTLSMGDWTAAAAKPLDMSVSAKFIDGSRQNIFLSKVSLTLAVDGSEGPLAAPEPLVDQATLVPGYLIKSPSSYGQVFMIPALASKATSVTVAITYELLAQTAPKAKTYAKQTASDTLTIAIQR